MFRRIKLWSLSIFGMILLFLMLGGLFVIFQISAKGEHNQAKVLELTSETQTVASYQILSMGDSLANGTGDVSGMGFAKDYAKILESKLNTTVNVTNLAVNGDTSDGLLTIVKDANTSKIISQANLILLSIGGNEVDSFVNDRSLGSSKDYAKVQTNYLTNLTTILSIIRSLNKDCKIGFLGLYNPYGQRLSNASVLQLLDWNTKTQELLLKQANTFYIPTYDLFLYHQDSYLTIDHFHPNVDGYQAIAKRVYEILQKEDTK